MWTFMNVALSTRMPYTNIFTWQNSDCTFHFQKLPTILSSLDNHPRSKCFFRWTTTIPHFFSSLIIYIYFAFLVFLYVPLVVQLVKNPPAMQETPSLIPGSGRSPGEGIGYCLSILAWRIPMDRGARWDTVHGVSESDMMSG